MAGRLAGKVALVTGAASGSAPRARNDFHDEGAQVAGLDMTLPDTHPFAAFVTADVRDAAAVGAVVDGLIVHLGRIDVLVNTAGVSSFGTADMIDEVEWNRVLDINLKGTWLVAACGSAGNRCARARAAS